MAGIKKAGTTGKMPLLPFSAMAAQGLLWTLYGLVAGNPAIYTPNSLAMLLGLRYCSIFSSYCPPEADWLPGKKGLHATFLVLLAAFAGTLATFASASTTMNVIGIVGNAMTMLMFAGPLVAVQTVIKEKSTSSMSFSFTCVVTVNCILWFFYGYFMLGDPYIWLSNVVGLALSIIQLGLFAVY